MRRRLLLSRLGLVALGIGTMTVTGRFLADEASPVERIIRERLPYIDISEDDLAKFVTDFAEYFGGWLKPPFLRRLFRGMVSAAGVAVPRPIHYLEPVVGSEAIETEVVTTFLLATDLFEQDADPSAPVTVRYRGIVDPYESGCGNPFAEF